MFLINKVIFTDVSDSQIFWGFNKYIMTSHDGESDVLKDTLSNNETKSNNGTEKKKFKIILEASNIM